MTASNAYGQWTLLSTFHTVYIQCVCVMSDDWICIHIYTNKWLFLTIENMRTLDDIKPTKQWARHKCFHIYISYLRTLKRLMLKLAWITYHWIVNPYNRKMICLFVSVFGSFWYSPSILVLPTYYLILSAMKFIHTNEWSTMSYRYQHNIYIHNWAGHEQCEYLPKSIPRPRLIMSRHNGFIRI